jgi:diaminopimelate epimerase
VSRAPISLVKGHADGNDFLLLRSSDAPAHIAPADLARAACDRHRGVGADGLIVVQDTAEGATTTLLNADGSPSEVSGNGTRCVAAWIAERRGLRPRAVLTIGTGAGDKHLTLLAVDDGRWRFEADMGHPTTPRQETIALEDGPVTAVVFRVGNPQCVVLGELSDARLHRIAGKLAVHPHFPEGTNVELALVEAPDRVRILIWERGVGPTEASGTGACAAAVAAAAFGGAARESSVIAPGGTQQVAWRPDNRVFLTGWAELTATIAWRVPDRS